MITGGSSGIGLQIAKTFLALGANVKICSQNSASLEAAKKDNPKLETYVCDLSKAADVKALVAAVGGEIDIWVNNGGIFLEYDFLHPDKTFDSLITELQINFVGAALAITELIPYFVKKPLAAIVNITAGMVYVPLIRNPMYNASKAALHSFIISARKQLENTPVRLIEIAPPMVATKLTEGMKGSRVSTQVIADAVIDALKTKKDNILVGNVKSLVFLSKFLPETMMNLVNNSLK